MGAIEAELVVRNSNAVAQKLDRPPFGNCTIGACLRLLRPGFRFSLDSGYTDGMYPRDFFSKYQKDGLLLYEDFQVGSYNWHEYIYRVNYCLSHPQICLGAVFIEDVNGGVNLQDVLLHTFSLVAEGEQFDYKTSYQYRSYDLASEERSGVTKITTAFKRALTSFKYLSNYPYKGQSHGNVGLVMVGNKSC